MCVEKDNIESLLEFLEGVEDKCKGDWERSHLDADRALLQYIGDERVDKLHDRLAPWYA